VVRNFEPVNWINNRVSRSLVCHLADDLSKAAKKVIHGMNKIIEADFLPRETNACFSWSSSSGGSEMKERRRILIVDNDPDTTHLVKVLLEKGRSLSGARW
jgi:hypothetical protein